MKHLDTCYILTIADGNTGNTYRTCYNNYEDAFRMMCKDITEQIIKGNIPSAVILPGVFEHSVCNISYNIVKATYVVYQG